MLQASSFPSDEHAQKVRQTKNIKKLPEHLSSAQIQQPAFIFLTNRTESISSEYTPSCLPAELNPDQPDDAANSHYQFRDAKQIEKAKLVL